MKFLEKIDDNPSYLKQLSRSDLTALAEEIRTVIVDVVSKNGGHLASNLGAVELAIAIHYVFSAPQDKIIWDVGHQAYAHKLLTGRYGRFPTLRQYHGLSGFTRMSESPYDAFSTGHSSTSLSAGLGMASAMHLKKETGKVVAVIGDGSMTAGLAYEALNHAGDLRRDLIIILNDNNMSISANVGALSSFLSRVFSVRKMQKLVKDFGALLKSIPKIGGDVYQTVKRSKESFKSFVTPGMLFEAFNVEYFGPISGHNLTHLIEMLNNLKDIHKPVLLHVETKKGKDYQPAEDNPVQFHGCGCFDIETGRCPNKKGSAPTYTEIFGCTLAKLAENDKRIVAVTAAMTKGTGLVEFAAAFPDRFFDVGIAEQHAVTFAAGLAAAGFKPVVAVYSTFLQRAYDQIVHDVCLESLPVVFAVDRGGIVGEDGPTHQGLFDLSYLRSLPNMVVMAPKDENELGHMLKTGIDHQGPVAIRYPRGTGTGASIDTNLHRVSIGKAEILQTGDDILILAIGRPVQEALTAHTALIERGIFTTVVNCRFVKPLDADLIGCLACKIPRIITIEENVRQGGFGSAVLECLGDKGITGFQIRRLGIPDNFVEHGPQILLRSKYAVDAAAIVNAAVKLFNYSRHYASRLTSAGNFAPESLCLSR
ncbi:MAG: 1-deoxy-D-xylulose-5-phosphate synthase [Desulfobacterales bacterium]